MEINNSRISSFSVIVIFVALIIIGISIIPLINIQLEPSRSLPTFNVSYSWADASAKVIEQEVTSKLEGLFSSINSIKDVNSVSYRGRGTINLSFKKNTNIDAVRFEVATLIRQCYPDLPEQVSYPVISVGTGGKTVKPVLTYNLNAPSSPWYIQNYAENNIVPVLSLVKGIHEVNVYGAVPYEWEIKFDVDIIHNLDINADEIVSAINTYFQKDIIGMGSYRLQGRDYNEKMQLILQNDVPREISWDKIPVKKTGSRIVFLTDLAEVRYKEQPPHSFYRVNGLNTITLVIYPEENVNNIKLAGEVKEKIAGISKNLPTGYSVMRVYDATEFISKELRKIALRTFFSMTILLLFVFIISRRFRYLLLITISLFANLIIACIFYYLLKLEIHLYSLAGITVSFGIIIDNSIIMIDHFRRWQNRRIFLAIFSATLTTIGALSILFFLEENQRINLIDFAQVIIVNLSVSLLIALLLIPALMEKIKFKQVMGRLFYRRKRMIIRIVGFYSRTILFSKKLRWLYFVLLLLGFGIPLHWLPDSIEKENIPADIYNKTIGSPWYQEKMRPIAEKIVGGSLRLFTEHVFEQSFYASPQRTTLNVRGKMPEGSTVHQLNEAIMIMENFISSFDELELFQTTIRDYRNASINIHFKSEYENGSFPYYLKEQLTSKAISLGGLDWNVYGVGRGFSNEIYSGYKNSHIILNGYNYDRLYEYAKLLSNKLLKMDRIHDVEITGSRGWGSTSLHEYYIDFNKELFGFNETNIREFYSFLNEQVYRRTLNPVFSKGELRPVTMVSGRAGDYNVWDLRNRPVMIENKTYKLGKTTGIEKRKTGNDIYKFNQQYRLVVAYDFIGPNALGNKVMEKHIEEINDILPLGYKATKRDWGSWWDRNDKNQYYLLLLIIVIIYFICSISLDSFIKPLAIIGMIPVSFMGVFLVFYLFDFNFDQGGFASFILLSGIVVNSGLYIINDYNQLNRDRETLGSLKIYLKAFNHKIVPIFLTVISTIVGLIPFLWAGQNEVFWFAFAVGAMGGLLFSFIAVVVYLPLFMKLGL